MDLIFTLEILIKGINLTVSVGKYLNIIKDKLQLKLEELAGSELEAGIRSLQQASNSDNERTFLLREARNRFNKAISLENDLRLAAAYIGLALCHSFLNDKTNAKIALNDLTKVTILQPSAFVTTVQKIPISPLLFLLPLGGILAITTSAYCNIKWDLYSEKANTLTQLQQEAKNLLQTL